MYGTLFSAGIIFLAFFLTCCCLVDRRFSKKVTIIIEAALLVGVVAFQAGLLLSGQSKTLVLTMLPLTAYLPVIIGMHVLSRAGFFQTVALWTLGLLVRYVLVFLNEVLVVVKFLEGAAYSFFISACLVVAAGLLLAVVIRFIRQPFRAYVLDSNTNWVLLCFPTLMVFLLFFYVDSSVASVTTWLLIFLTALSVFLVVARVLTAVASAARMQEAQQAIAAQLDIQRREYEGICKKMEMGRAYRHDMRHHLRVLDSLAQGENNKEIARYLSDLDERIRETEQQTYCENTTVNAVLSSYIGKAKEAGCTVSTNVRIPATLPIDDLDICAVLGNALENAIEACSGKSDTEARHIELTAVLEEGGKFVVSVENPCKESLSFDREGLPVVPKREGHGVGLKSIKSIAENYRGLFSCECKDDVFQVSVVLFEARKETVLPQEKVVPKRMVPVPLATALTLCVVVSCVPLLQTWAETPGYSDSLSGKPLSYSFRWGDTALNLVVPKVELAKESPVVEDAATAPQQTPSETVSPTEPKAPAAQPPAPSSPAGSFSWESNGGTNSDPAITPPPVIVVPRPPAPNPNPSPSPNPDTPGSDPVPDTPAVEPPNIEEGVEDINQKMEEYVATLRDKFLWYVARKYNGYVGMDSTYTTLRNDGELLIVRFITTLNVGGSSEYFRYFILDMRTGKVLELSDLFTPESDYVSVVSSEILRQMTEKVNAGEADYFIPGGIWDESDWFKAIEPDQNFYLNDNNQLVIVFEKYEVAPGKEGVPEFTVPTEVLDGILRQPTLLE